MNWTISISPVIHDRFLELYEEAVLFGQGAAFEEAVRTLRRRLVANPFDVGEISYHLRGGQPVLVGVEAPVSITFAVYEPQQIIVISRVVRLASANE
jgi:hypothetical protein